MHLYYILECVIYTRDYGNHSCRQILNMPEIILLHFFFKCCSAIKINDTAHRIEVEIYSY